MDISSDSSNTIILPLHNDADEPSDTEIELILKKYTSTSNIEVSKTSTSSQKYNDLDLSDGELNEFPLVKKARKKLDENDINKITSNFEIATSKQVTDAPKSSLIILSDSSEAESGCENSDALHKDPPRFVEAMTKTKEGKDLHSFEEDSEEELKDLSPKVAAKMKRQKEIERKRREKERKREETERKKAMKNLEKENKKEALEQQKALKTALKSIERSTKPDECIKHMMVEIDKNIFEEEYGTVLKATLKNNDIMFRSTSQIIPKLISWRRKQQTIENMFVKNTEVAEKHVLLVIDTVEFTNLVRNDSLIFRIQEIVAIMGCQQLSLAVFGIDKVRGDQDFAVTEAQIFTKCYFRFMKKSEDLSAFVMELTKAVAQIPYKLKKEEKYMLQSEYFNDSNKDTVRVDKNGNGLSRLWHQMLTMFPLARLETAEAITAAYPTPASLFKAYETCTDKKEELLQDLRIRRAIGPCASVRRLGPELSRKCFNFFCSTENVLL